ncbi:TonB-dependent receptor [uncultured Psychrosphaera sp.]|uniref:TonB-dependent receptor n=1 Tax=uncultured Psychrosphaera sp. TaxID=1403522 RepID=UPI002635BC2D|nr:TonB-dependent receptor [uncultured Psychrosphaera sp.]
MKLTKLALAVGFGLNTISLGAMADVSAIEDIAQESKNEKSVTQTIEAIVVRGQKIDRSIQETPTSVAVITAKDIEKQNVQNVSDVFSGMANVTGTLSDGFTIRGIDAFNVSGGGGSYLATMYFDGAPLPWRVVNNGAVPVWDLSQVEVFRGPQSTLQGRNALAGAVHIRSQDPTYDWSGKGKVTIGNLGQKEYAFAGGGSIIDDMLAFRVSVEDKELEGDIDNVTRNEMSNYEESNTVRGKLLYQPTDNVTALLTLSNTTSELGVQWATYEYGADIFDRKNYFNSPTFRDSDTDIATLEVSWDITDQLSLVSVITTNTSESGYNWDGDSTSEQLSPDTQNTRTDKTNSQELRLAYDGDNLQAVVGFYASDLDVVDNSLGGTYIDVENALGYDFQTAVTGLLMTNGLDGATASYLAGQVTPLYPDIDPILLDFTSDFTQSVSTKALFADVTYSINDSFDLLAGLRFENEEQANDKESIYSILNTMPDPSVYDAQTGAILTGINGYLNGLADSSSGTEPLSSTDFDAFLPKLGVSYHINQDMTTSFTYQKGYRSGGVGTNTAQNYLYTYDSEYTDNYELSYRSVWMAGQFVFNANAFVIQWKDQQVLNQLSTRQFDVETQNAGESEVKGVDTEIVYYPNQQLRITAGLGYSKSEFIDYTYVLATTGEDVDLSGRSFADAPTITANISVDYDFDSGVYTNINANYQDSSKAYFDPVSIVGEDGGDPENDARMLVNAQVGYDFGNYQVRFDIRNLLDEEYISVYSDAAIENGQNGQHIIGRSRQVSLSVQAAF